MPTLRPSNPSNLVIGSDTEDLAERYYAMAEELNSRGAMELAVPFYRQALALLLAGRDTGEDERPAGGDLLGSPALQGLLEAARSLEESQSRLNAPVATAAPTVPDEPEVNGPQPSSDQLKPEELEAQLEELAAGLNGDSAATVLEALAELEERAGQLPARGLGMRGKALLLTRQGAAALEALEQGLALEPGLLELQINAAAAEMMLGQTPTALLRLRRAYQNNIDSATPELRAALLRNLATAEAKAGNPAIAMKLRHQWLGLDPQALPREQWLAYGKRALEQGHAQESAEFLERLRSHHGNCTTLLTLMADAHERAGDYQRAAQAYREMLQAPGSTSANPK